MLARLQALLPGRWFPDTAPVRDGVLAGLLVAEMVAKRGKSLGVQLKELFAKVGSFYPIRENFRLTQAGMVAFTEKLKADPAELSGRKVAQVVRTDGLKLILADGSWVCYRLSGTEPVVRAYTEARSEQDSEALKAAAWKVEELAEDEILDEMGIESPYDLQGLYHGTPLGARSVGDVARMPDRTISKVPP